MNKNRLGILCIGFLVWAHDGLAQDADRGAKSYQLCAGCHGFKGEGNQVVNAPALAGQEPWYLERQIQNFISGIRGASEGDVHGQTMAQMSRGLTSDREVADIIAHIGTLPTPSPAKTIDGDVEKGRANYTPCAACHGANAEGIAALNAPALRTIDDWYQLRQLQKFRNGMRGASPADTYGAQMAPMAATLADEQAMRDVIAYINSL